MPRTTSSYSGGLGLGLGAGAIGVIGGGGGGIEGAGCGIGGGMGGGGGHGHVASGTIDEPPWDRPWLLSTTAQLHRDALAKNRWAERWLSTTCPFPGVPSDQAAKLAWLAAIDRAHDRQQDEFRNENNKAAAAAAAAAQG